MQLLERGKHIGTYNFMLFRVIHLCRSTITDSSPSVAMHNFVGLSLPSSLIADQVVNHSQNSNNDNVCGAGTNVLGAA